MKNILYITAVIFTLTLQAQQTPAATQSQAYTIMNATAHVGNGSMIANSIIVIKDGKISVIGNAETMKIAPQGEVINAQGMHVYPGFIAPNSSLGLVEIDAVKATVDEAELGEFNPNIRSIIAYNAESHVVESMRPNGVLLAQVAPRGGAISGQSSVVQLDAWNWEDAIIKENDGIHMNWPVSFKKSGPWYNPGPLKPNKKYEKRITELNEFFASAKAYTATSSTTDLKYSAMQPVLNGSSRLYIHVNGKKEVRDVLDFIQANGIKNVVLVGGYGAQFYAQEIAVARIPILVRRVHSLPLRVDDDYDLPYKLPYLLTQAGILVGLENQGSMERHQTRNLPFYAGTVTGHGMSKEEALQLITLNTAQILGIDDQYGSLETGKSATLFISTGDALDIRGNQPVRAFIDGRDISLESHQTQLHKRYSKKYEQD